MKSILRVGTRGSALALAQTKIVTAALAKGRPNIKVETKVIRTTGDEWAQKNEPGATMDKGMFTKELEDALLRHEIDVAVHSLKDMPVDEHAQLTISATPLRADARDVMISRYAVPFEKLPPGATLATGSLRRSCQLQARRPDLRFVDIRGNLDTRIQKLRDNISWHGLIVAAAGLERLKPDLTDFQAIPLDYNLMLPAAGQGCLALQTRTADPVSSMTVICVHDFETACCVMSERAFLQALGGGCQAPIGAYARLLNNELELTGIYFTKAGTEGKMGTIKGNPDDGEELGRKLAAQLLS